MRVTLRIINIPGCARESGMAGVDTVSEARTASTPCEAAVLLDA